MQALDAKTLSRLEAAVSKSPYAGQGSKLRVTNKVCAVRELLSGAH